MIALLSGPPGIGKTTVATALVQRQPSRVSIVSFGELVYKAVRDRLGVNLSYPEFRAAAADLVMGEDIMTATTSITERKPGLDKKWLIVDSHAVAETGYGWQAHPDTPDTLKRFAYDVIFYLHARPEIILRRIRKDAAGRHLSAAHGTEMLDRVQMTICTYYAGIIGCPLEIIDAAGEVSEVVNVLEGILGLAPGRT